MPGETVATEPPSSEPVREGAVEADAVAPPPPPPEPPIPPILPALPAEEPALPPDDAPPPPGAAAPAPPAAPPAVPPRSPLPATPPLLPLLARGPRKTSSGSPALASPASGDAVQSRSAGTMATLCGSGNDELGVGDE